MTDCVSKEFEFDKDGNVDLYFRGKYPIVGYKGVDGVLYDCPDGQCHATMGGSPREKAIPFDFFWTDYDNFEVSYNCSSLLGGLMKNEMLSISGRNPTMTPEVMMKAQDQIKEKLPDYYDYMFNPKSSWMSFIPMTYNPLQGDQCSYDWRYTPLAQTK